VVAGAGGLVCGAFLIWMTTVQSKPTPEPPSPVVEPPKKPEIVCDIAAVRENEIIAVRRRVKRLREDMDEILAVKRRLEAMYTNDDGRKVAADIELVQQFLAIASLVTLENVGMWDSELGEFETSLELGSEPDVGEQLPDDGALMRLEENVSDAVPEFRRVGRLLDALVANVPTESSKSSSLKDVIERQKKEREAALLIRLGEAREAAERQVAAELKEIERQIGSIKGDIDRLHKKAEEADATYRKKEVEIKDAHAKMLREEEARFDDLKRRYAIEFPKFEKYLKPFTDSGYKQPNGKHFVRTTSKGPVSYSKLLASGLLEENRDSLFWFQTSVDSGDRELGAFPPSDIQGINQLETVLAIQRFLREFGPIMAEEGDLAP
jgi:hypothetical protein